LPTKVLDKYLHIDISQFKCHVVFTGIVHIPDELRSPEESAWHVVETIGHLREVYTE